MHWNTEHIPSQRGRLFVVTGTGGLALEDAAALAGAGASVILAGRNPAKGAAAVAAVRRRAPDAQVAFEGLDLARLDSVAAFAERLGQRVERLDGLINNAAVMTPPRREQTPDGFELQLGTNYLGHFALTARLWPLLRATPGARVVSLSSVAARDGEIDFDDLQSERAYAPMKAYAQSKLACLLFAFELQRRAAAAGVTSVAAHPGIARTDLLHNAPGRWSAAGLARSVLWFLFQPAWQGALPTLYAATAPEAEGGGYYGPHQLGETRGYPTAARVPPRAADRDAARRLWEVSEGLTGTALG